MTLTWPAFLSLLLRLLDSVSEGTPFAALVYDNNRAQAGPGDILLGMGQWDAAPGIALTIKGLPEAWGVGYLSVSDLVATPPAPLTSAWGIFAGRDFDLTERMPHLHLVVKDISPDSSLALVLLLARLCGALDDEALRALAPWLAQVRRWESGRMLGFGQADWCVLHSALVHAYIDEQQIRALSSQQTPGLARAWLHGLRYLVALLHARANPVRLDQLDIDTPPPQQRMAEAALAAEYQAYQHSLQSATRLQLALPIRGPERRRLVDAWLTTELLPGGVAKVFLRNDRDHAWSGQGFALMGVHLPHLREQGGHITLSVEPDSGLHLHDLWRELERLEDAKWAGQRPRGNPRKLNSYPAGDCPDEPWWDDHGLHTLLGSPRTVVVNGIRVPGSRLDWTEVLDALWRVYHPLTGIRLLGRKDAPDSLVEITQGSLPAAACPGYRTLFWPKPGRVATEVHQAPLVFSPTVRRFFAALAAGREGSLNALPQDDEFDFLNLTAGYAWVHRQGVLLLDDWRPEDLDDALLRTEFDRARTLQNEVAESQIQLTGLANQVAELIAGVRAAKEMDLLRRLAHLQGRLRELLTRYAEEAHGHDARLFRTALEQRWTSFSQLEYLAEEADQVANTLRAYSEVRGNRILFYIGVYGFPLVFWGGFFQFVLQSIPWPGVYFTQGRCAYLIDALHKVHWAGIGAYIVLVALTIAVLYWRVKRSASRRPSRGEVSESG